MKTSIFAILALAITGWAAAQPEERALRADGFDLARERLIEAVVAVQSQLPASPAQLEAVFRAPNCYYSRYHVTTTTICLFDGTPFEAMRRFVQIVDGEIRAPRGLKIGRDVMTHSRRESGCFAGGLLSTRDHYYATIWNDVGGGIVFGSMAMREWKRDRLIDWERRIRVSMLATLYSSLQRLPQLDELPRMASSSMRSTRRGSSSKSSPVTVAGAYVAGLVNAARSHAAAMCVATVRNGTRLANVFSSKAPAEGEAARIYYRDASRVIRAELEQTAATGGADDLCRRTDMRALVAPALERATR